MALCLRMSETAREVLNIKIFDVSNLRIHRDSCKNVIKISHLLLFSGHTQWYSKVKVATVNIRLYIVTLGD